MSKLVEKFGIDKITHFLAGYTIASFINIILVMQENLCDNWTAIPLCLAGIIMASFIGAFKEVGVDTTISKRDFIATVLGAVVSIIPIAIGILFNLLSN